MARTRNDALFLKACRREATPRTPVWLLRQAGRYMKEYRDIRAKVPFLELCKSPDLACEVTVTAAEKIGADAAIIFSDILLITEPLGFRLTFASGEGPVIENPFLGESSISALRSFSAADELRFVLDAIRNTRAALPPEIPLIGFAGAPFTVASYLIEGGKSRTFEKTKQLMETEPAAWNTLLSAISMATTGYLNAQISAGADAVQLFDSWIGVLSPEEYDRSVAPHVRSIFSALPASIPAIHFGTNTAPLITRMKMAGGTVIGLDSTVSLDQAWQELGDVAVQGNFDPNLLLGSRSEIEQEAKRVLDQAAGRPGHIFNLGHGVLPQTPVDNVRFLIDFVREESTR
ncbi:MAG: uroporphyrinogen decarboxylase [Pseudomonadota bacterium]